MADYLIQGDTLTGIADAIRAKTGKTELILPGDMPSEIGSIQTGGGGSVPSNITAVLRAIHGVLLKAMYTQDVSSTLAEILEMINSGSGGGDEGDTGVFQSGSNLYVISGVTASQSGSVMTIS